MSSVRRTPSTSSTRAKSTPPIPTARSQGSAAIPFDRLSIFQLERHIEKFPGTAKAIHERLIEKQPEEIEQAHELGRTNPGKGALAFQNLAFRNLKGHVIPQDLNMALEMALEALKLNTTYGAATLLHLAKAYAKGDFKIKKNTPKALRLILKAAIINPEAAGNTIKEISNTLKIEGVPQNTLQEYAFALQNDCKKIPLNTPMESLPGFKVFFEAFIKKFLPEIEPKNEDEFKEFFEANHRPAIMPILQDLSLALENISP